ncbi:MULTISPECIES: transglutaminase-like domain-containing protein [unclassified Luteococcus]|uniref:transglutaminase-like domain-containing protein n=1 Tax=unclassified Luteococcus TaxID=2639923 RepID=UPI00313EE7FC
MTSPEAALRQLDVTLGPVLQGVGFQPAQIGADDHTATTTYCAPLTTIRTNFPDLPDGSGYEDVDFLCYDVIVEVQQGRLREVRCEGIGLDEMLIAIGRDDAADRYQAQLGQPASEGRDELTEMLRAVFSHRSPDPDPPASRRFLAWSWVMAHHNQDVAALHDRLTADSPDQLTAAKRIYEYVRDEIRHSLDHGDTAVTLTAYQVLEQGTGLCYAKSHLAAALFRRSGIPAGLAYQLIDGDDGPVLHGLVAIHVDGAWHRLDVRGNKPGVDAQFDLERERLAFTGEGVADLPGIHAEPTLSVVNALVDATDLREVRLPSSL